MMALGQDAQELVAEYNRCDDPHERNVVLWELREVDHTLRIHREQAEGLAALPDTWGAIYGHLRGHLGLFSGSRREGKLTDPRSRYEDWPKGVDQAVDWVEREMLAGRELYHCAHLLTERRRRKDAAAPIAALWVDRDTPATSPNQLASPSLVVESSPGHTQEYWRLRRPVPPQEAAAYNRHLAQLVGADPSGWDLTQLLRIPGSGKGETLPPPPPLSTVRERFPSHGSSRSIRPLWDAASPR